MPGEIWGLDPQSGLLKWFVKSRMPGNVSPTVVVHDGIVYASGGYPEKGVMAVKTGGQGNVTDTHIVWSKRQSTYVPSPVYHDGYLYWVSDRGLATCINAKTGDLVFEERLPVSGGLKQSVYASMVLANNSLYAVSRTGGTVVLKAEPEFKILEQNLLASDTSEFNATPAISGNAIYLRSNTHLYCFAAK